MTRFYVGTAGWSYLQWDKEFYPKVTKSNDKLNYYARQFNAVELNNSFYRMPEAEQFLAWEAQVSQHFRFAVKASRFITHIKRLKEPQNTLPPFSAALALQQQAGPVFFQLPPVMPLDLERLHNFLHKLPPCRRYAMELRDPRWHTQEVYQLLKRFKVAFCLFDVPEGISPRVLTTDYAYRPCNRTR